MSDQPTASLELALLGNDASFEQMTQRAEARLDKLAQKVEATGQRIQSGLDRMLNSISASAVKVSETLQPVVDVLGNVASSASVAGAEVKAASSDLRGVAGDARAAAVSLEAVATAGKSAGDGLSSGMSKTVQSVQKGQNALRDFVGMVNRVRTAANKPIVQKVTVRRSGSPSVGGNGGGRAEEGFGAAYGLEQAGNTLTTTGLALAAPLAAATAATTSFDEAIQKAAGNTNLTAAEVDVLRQNVITLAKETNAPIQQITDSFMRASNFGFTGAKAMEVVRAANIAAVASGADLDKVTLALAQTMSQFKVPTGDAASVMSMLKYNADATNQTLQDYVSNCARGFQAASTLGVGLADAASVMGVLTKSGLNAAQSQTAFRAVVKGIIAPTKQASDEIKTLSDKTGVDLVGAFSAAGLAHYGLVGVMGMVAKATHGNADELKKLFTDQRNFIPILTLLTSKHHDLAAVLEGDKAKFRDHSLMMGQYADATKKAYYQLGELKNRAIVAAVSFENQLAPALKGVVGYAERFLNWLQQLSPREKELAVDTLAAGAAINILAGVVLTVTGRLVGLWNGVKTFILWIGKIAPAAEAAEAAEAGIATAGLAAFGPGAVLILALSGMIALVWRAVDGYNQMRDAINDAASARKRFTDAQSQAADTGEHGALEVESQKIAIARDALQDQIMAQKQQTALVAAARKRGDTAGADNLIVEMKSNPDKFGDTNDGGLQRMITRRNQMNADYNTERARLHEMNTSGAGEANRALDATGADGFARSAVGHAFDSINTPKNLASCAFFVSEVFKRAGAALPGGAIGSAKGLMDWAVQHGAQAHSAQDAMPGDLVVYHGGKYGKNHSGYHVAIYLGDNKIRESSGDGPGHVRTSNFYDKAHATAYTIPGSTFANGGLPSYVTGGNGAKPGPQTDTATAKSAPSPMAHVPLKPLHDPYPPSLSGPTGADNYAAKLEHLDAALTDNQSTLQASGAAYNSFSVELSGWAQKMMLADNAAQNTQKVMEALTPKVAASQKAYTDANAALNAQIDKTNRLRAAGAKVPASDKAELARLRERVQMTYAAAQADEKALSENKRVHAQALADADRFKGEYNRTNTRREQNATEWFLSDLKDHLNAPGQNGLTRDQYDNYLQTAMAGKNKDLGKLNPQGDDYKRIQAALEESQTTRANATSELGMKTLRLDHKDTQALQQELDEEVAALQKAGVDQNKIDEYVVKRTAEIHRAGFEQQRKDADDLQKVNMELGQETQGDYQRYLISTLQAVQQEYGETSLEVARLKLEILKIDWDAVAQQADGYKAALDTGKLSIESYIVSLRALQTNLPVTSEEYKRLGDEVESANKKIHDDAKAKADAVGGQFADAFMKVAEKAASLKQVVHEALKDALETAAKDQIKQAFSKLAFKVIQDHNDRKMQDAVREHKPVVDKFAVGVTAFQGGVDKFGQWVAQFTTAMSQPVPGTGGAFGQGNTSGGGFGQGTVNNGSAFGGTASGTSPAGSSPSGSSPSLTPQSVPAGKGNTAKSVASATNDINAGMEVASVTKNGVGSGIGAVSTAASLAGNIASVSKWASVGSALSAAAPYIGLVTTALALFGMFGSHNKTPTKTQGQNYASALSTFSSTIDSGYSGSDGLRTLLGPTTRQAAGVSSAGQVQPGGHTLNITIAAGAFQGVPDPQAHGTQVVQTIHDGIAQLDRLNNASRGEG